MAEVFFQELDSRRVVVVCQHVVGHYSQLQKPLHANGDVKESRVEIAILVLKKIGLQQQVKASQQCVFC